MKRIHAFLIPLLACLSVPFDAAAEIYRCKGQNGKDLYTDDKNKCVSATTKVEVKAGRDTRVNYRYPERQYLDLSGRYLIFVEAPESDTDSTRLESAAARIESTLDLVYSKIPVGSHAYLRTVKFYIMIGPRARLGGESSGLRYYPKNGDAQLLLGDKRWRHAVVVSSVDNLLSLSDLWTKKAMVHELAHAWHFKDWNKNYPKMMAAWATALQQGLYLSQKDVNGRILTPAYASTNEKEYFAELSAIYFVGGNYFPFSRQELQQYDPTGLSMIADVWEASGQR